jgi:hypothetical protein
MFRNTSVSSFGTASREKGGAVELIMKRTFPGPGAYSIMSKIGNEGHKQTLTGRRPEYDTSHMKIPGPGAYNTQTFIDKPKHPVTIMGTSKRGSNDSKLLNNPSPGSYDPQESPHLERSPKIKFGTEKRSISTIKCVNSPGPGAYNIPSRIHEGPKVWDDVIFYSVQWE